MRFLIPLAAAFLLTPSQPAAGQTMTMGYTMRATVTTTYSFAHPPTNDKVNETFVWTAMVTDTWKPKADGSGTYSAQFDSATNVSTGASGAGSEAWSVVGGCANDQFQGDWQYGTAEPSYKLPVMGTIMIMTGIGTYAMGPPFPQLAFKVTGKSHEVDASSCGSPTETDDETYDDEPEGNGAPNYAQQHWLDAISDKRFTSQWIGSFDPVKGYVTGGVHLTYDDSYDDPGESDTLTITTTVDIGFTLTMAIPNPPPTDPDDDCNCKSQGSIVGAQDQSLGEAVAIAGTPFTLRYQSGREPGRLGSSAAWTAKNLYLGGWSLDVLHAYDSKAGVLYLGSGDRRTGDSAKPVPTADGGFLIPAQDANLIYQFGSNGLHTNTLDEFTGTAVYQFVYDSNGRLTGIKDTAGNLTTIERSGDKPTAIAGPFGHRTTLSTDSSGYLSKIIAPDGAVTTMTYSSQGLMTTLTDPNKNQHTFTFDSDGRLIQDTEPDGEFQTLARMAVGNGHAVVQTSSDGLATTYTVLNPGAGAVFQTQLPDGSAATGVKSGPFFGAVTGPTGMTTNVTYGQDSRWGLQAALPSAFSTATPAGVSSSGTLTRTVTLSDPSNPLSLSALQDTVQFNGRTYSTSYSSSNRTFTATSPAGRQITRTLDARGRILSRQANGLGQWQYTYNTQGRLSTLARGSGDQQRTAKYAYGTDGFLSSYTDALGQVTTYKRDKAGRVTSRTLPDNSTVTYAYDPNGNMTSVTPPGRTAHTFLFTPLNQPSFYVPPIVSGGGMPTAFLWNAEREPWQVSRPDSGVVTRTYDNLGHVTALSFPNGQLTYSYDPKTGQRTQVSGAAGNSLSYSYDGDLPLSYTWAGAVSSQVQFTYDADFRVNSVAVNGGNPLAVAYDPDGYVVNTGDMTLTRDPTTGLISGTSLDKIADTPAYNSFGELTQYTATGPNGALITAKYTRDKLGRVTDKSETIGSATTVWHYGYDAAGRLTSVDKNGAAAARYTYDSNGNRTRVTVSGANEDATYDAQDRLTARGAVTYQYAAGGELTLQTSSGQQTQYEYDALGNLGRVLLPGGKEIRYLADGENRRIGKLVNATLAKAFLYQDGLRPAAELDGSGNVVSLFVYGDSTLAPVYFLKGGVKYRIVADHLGSPRLVVNSTTGEIVQRIDYDAFGTVTADTNPGFQPFGFAGGLYDPDTGLVRFGARDYDAAAGRWTAKDPLGLAGGSTNLYAYAGNDPVNRLDPRGTDDSGDYFPPVAPTCGGPDDPLAPLTPATTPDDPLAPLVPQPAPDDPIAPLVPAPAHTPDDPIVPLVPPQPAKPPANATPCPPGTIWVKKGDGPWMPWHVTPTGAWPAW